MDDDIDVALRERLAGALLPTAPEKLHVQAARLRGSTPPIHPVRRIGVGAVIATTALVVGALAFTSTRQLPTTPPGANAVPSQTEVVASGRPIIDGMVARSVGELLADRASGRAPGGPYAVMGYWTIRILATHCAPPPAQPGELELWCRDGQWGITENSEAIQVIQESSFAGTKVIPAKSPHLTPWFGSAAVQEQLFNLPGANWPPVPIVAVGHFDDELAGKCRPEARSACSDRFVIDVVGAFDPQSVPSPTPAPSATPFPVNDPPPPALADEACFIGREKTVLGWVRVADLGIKLHPDWDPGEYVYAIATVAAIPIGDPTVQLEDTWHVDPKYPDHMVRWWGRQVCFSQDGTSIFSGTVIGSTYLEVDDGRTIVEAYPFG